MWGCEYILSQRSVFPFNTNLCVHEKILTNSWACDDIYEPHLRYWFTFSAMCLKMPSNWSLAHCKTHNMRQHFNMLPQSHNKTRTHSLTHSFSLSFTHLLSHSLSHSLIQLLSKPLTSLNLLLFLAIQFNLLVFKVQYHHRHDRVGLSTLYRRATTWVCPFLFLSFLA